MNVNRIASALDRIAAAVDRIERVRPVEGDAGIGLRLTHLTARHDRLRTEARTALTALDALIADAGGEARHG